MKNKNDSIILNGNEIILKHLNHHFVNYNTTLHIDVVVLTFRMCDKCECDIENIMK